VESNSYGQTKPEKSPNKGKMSQAVCKRAVSERMRGGEKSARVEGEGKVWFKKKALPDLREMSGGP